MPIKKSGFYKGKSNKIGGGGRFQQMVDSMPKNMPLSEKKAIAAKAGRRELGKARFQKIAATGRRRAK